MNKQLLREFNLFEYTKKLDNGKLMMKGILQRSDVLNQNGRVYPKHILEREIRNYEKFIRENRALGELDHPTESIINLKNVSHIVREINMDDGGVVYGTIEILDTPSGKILKSLVESGVKIGISSRAVGSTKNDGDHEVVQEDLAIICWDCVSDPSTPNAFLMREGRIVDNDTFNKTFTKSDKIDRILNDLLD